MRGRKTPLSTSHFFEDASGETLIFHADVKFATFILWGMSQAKRLFLQTAVLVISQFGEDVPSEIAIFGRQEDALGVVLALVFGSSGPSRSHQK